MKIQDPISRRIVAAGIALSAIICSASIFILTLNHAFANPKTDPVSHPLGIQQMNASGKIMMFPHKHALYNQYGEYVSDDNYVLVWDSETGESRSYIYYDHKEKGWGWWAAKNNLPANPLGQ